MKTRWATCALLVGLAFATVLVFLQRPGLGDDFTYWRFAFAMGEGEKINWADKGFHSLRWTVWGVCFGAIRLFGPGLASYYAAPFLYAALGAGAAFLIARHLVGNRGAGWVAAFAFLFHPLLSPVIYRPMPEVPEAVFGALAVACWFASMRAPGAGRGMAWAAASGLAVAVAHANRFTGLLIIPVLGLLTLGFFPRRWPRLVVLLAAAGLFFLAECAIYRQVTGDFWHSIHQNLGARGRKGTEAVALWRLPFRFLDTLVQGKFWGVLLFLLAAAGGWRAWGRFGTPGRIVVAWAAWLFLGYSCALQGFDPPRPMIRDGPRFLGSMAVPLSVLVAVGARWLWDLSAGWGHPVWARARRGLSGHAFAAAAGAWLLLVPVSNRDLFDPDYIPAFSGFLGGLPEGTRVFAPQTVREFSHLINGAASRRVRWEGEFDILEREAHTDAAAARSDYFLYSRRLLLLGERKAIQYKGDVTPPELPPYFAEPEKDWRLIEVIQIDARPEVVIYRKRTPEDPPARVVPLDGAEFSGLGLRLPLEWEGGEREFAVELPVPASLRGARLRLNIFGASDEVEAVVLRIAGRRGGKTLGAIEAKSHFHPVPALDFIAFDLPPDADSVKVEAAVRKGTKRIRVEKLWLTVDPPPGEAR